MKISDGKITYKNREYNLVFNLNVMEAIQEQYGSIGAWGELTKPEDGTEPNAKAVIFGITAMLNEGIDIENEEAGTVLQPFTLRQVGRLLSDVGLATATAAMEKTVIESTKSAEKNG